MNATAVKTEPRTRTEKRMFNGREVVLNYKNEDLISVTADGVETRICKSEYKTLCKINNVKFRIPDHSIKSRIITGKRQFRIENRKLIEILLPSYFQNGIIIGDKGKTRLVTRNFFESFSNPYNLPFGKIVLGTIEIKTCITHTGEERIIIDFAIGKVYSHKDHGQYAWKEIKFISELPEKYDFSFNLFPGEENTTYIVVK